MPIACLSIPRFAVEVERRRRPELSARLILIGDAAVFDCSLGAESASVARGMRMSEAIGLCHRAAVLLSDIPYYKRQFDEVLDFLMELSPEVEAGGLGLAYLSLNGLPVAPVAFAEGLVASLHRRFGFMAAAGVACGKFPARVAAVVVRPGLTKVIPAGDEASFLAPLPVSHLPFGDALHWRLHLLGLETMADIARLPLGAFQQQFGPEGKRCWELASGLDLEPLVPRLTEETVVRRLQLPAPAVNIEAIYMAVERLIYAAYGDPVRGGRWVRKVIVRANMEIGGAWELPVAFREALSNPRDAWFAVKTAITRRPPDRPVEELAVELIGLSSESGKQASMFENKGKLWRQIEEMMRQLRAGQSAASVGKVVEVEPWSRIPERRTALADFEPSA